MAKSQKRSNREIRKPKAMKFKTAPTLTAVPQFPVHALMQRHNPKH